jgi:hypothetical protein
MNITKVVVLLTRNPEKLSLQFSEFSTISREFTRSSKSVTLLKLLFCAKDPARIWNLTNMPLVHGKHPRTTWGVAIRALAWGGGGAGRISASRPCSRPGKWWGTTLCSPRALGWPELGRGTRRRGRTAKTGGGRRCGLRLRRGRRNAEQRVAAQASSAPRE